MKPRMALAAVVVSALMANIIYPGTPSVPPGWEAVDTNFGAVAHEPQTALVEFAAAEWIQSRARASRASVIVFPEAVVPMWTEATDLFWQSTLSELRAHGKIALIGASLPAPGRRLSYLNVALVRGAENGIVAQRVPVPLGMWKPLSRDGVPLNLFGAGDVVAKGQRAAIFICYEQLITWPALESMLERPTVIVGMANDYWTSATPIRQCQEISIRSWSRLFRIPWLMAVNR